MLPEFETCGAYPGRPAYPGAPVTAAATDDSKARLGGCFACTSGCSDMLMSYVPLRPREIESRHRGGLEVEQEQERNRPWDHARTG
ncbi:hypothetical protein EVAR_85347_1 [Eumeta japonica]|uniref:Uncharacterized protein n=1 Tax=Eumeta variegata TaxID=151549 RepID=A0A4C1WVG4_EUMVA|nr:hypothetical protein EVAR_85347_1 [Eumeta japonica]